MSWIGTIVGVGTAIYGAKKASKSAKEAANTAAEGSERAIEFQRESRDIALDLGSPYRAAGYKGLDKIGEMTGLIEPGGTFGRPSQDGSGKAVTAIGTPWGNSDWTLGWDAENGRYTASGSGGQNLWWDSSNNMWMTETGSAYGKGYGSGGKPNQDPDWSPGIGGIGGGGGKNVKQKAYGGVMYNINELGPENVYSGGAITRSSNPKTMPPDPNGYVQPNNGTIMGRQKGGVMINPESMGDMVDQVWPGGTPNFDERTGRYRTGRYRDVIKRYGGTKLGFGGYDGSGINPESGVGAKDIHWNGQIGVQPGPGGPKLQPGDVNDMPADARVIVDNSTPVPSTPAPQENPYDFTTDPGYIFRFNEGMRGLEGSAAARGGLLSGGFGRKAIRYGQDYASNEFSNIYNRIANVAGLGQVSASQGGVFAQNAGANMGNAAQAGANASAYGQQASGNAWANAGNEIAQLPWGDLPWGDVFGGNKNPTPSGGGGGWGGSDKRLKENVKHVATDSRGYKWYIWNWNSTAEELGFGDQPTFGVMADELKDVKPEAVSQGKHGYLMVDYGAL